MLHTARTRLRPWQPADAPALLALMQNDQPRFSPYFPKTLAAVHYAASATVFVEQKRREWDARQAFQLGIWLPDDPRCAGWISLKSLEWTVPKAELAYLLAGWAEGQGLLAEVGPAVLHWAFTGLGLTRIYCRVNPTNTRSIRLVERLGFQREGLLRQDFRSGTGELADCCLYGLLAADFLAQTEETA